MSENFERAELELDMYDEITGGELKWRYDPRNNRYKVCSTFDESKQYGVSLEKTIDAQTYSKTECHGMSDERKLEKLVEENYIWPLF